MYKKLSRIIGLLISLILLALIIPIKGEPRIKGVPLGVGNMYTSIAVPFIRAADNIYDNIYKDELKELSRLDDIAAKKHYNAMHTSKAYQKSWKGISGLPSDPTTFQYSKTFPSKHTYIKYSCWASYIIDIALFLLVLRYREKVGDFVISTSKKLYNMI